MENYSFLFSELVKRDFKKKYKSTFLGFLWSVLSPLLSLLVMRLVFTQLFGRDTPHYTTYLFAGNLLFSFFTDATGGGMTSFLYNGGIITKLPVPKTLFLFSRSVTSLINLSLNLLVFFLFALLDGISLSGRLLLLLFPVLMLTLFAIGVSLVLATAFVHFRDTQYLWGVFTTLLSYLSVIFYRVEAFPVELQSLFLLNPVYCAIRYVREVVIDAVLPSGTLHLLLLVYAAAALGLGALIYRRRRDELAFYL